MPKSKSSVIVIGAGIAGLAAARELVRENVRVTILEARRRIGGRIQTRPNLAGATVELGAEFVHGRQPDLMRLVKEAGLHLTPRKFEPLSLKDGQDVTPEQSWDRLFEEIANPNAEDIPISRHIDALLASGRWNESEALRLRAYIEGYMAGDPDRISARAVSEESRAAGEIEDEHNDSIAEGYINVASHLMKEIQRNRAVLMLDHPVTRVNWAKGTVRVHWSETGAMNADAAIVTVPLGILQLGEDDPGAIRFEPPLPPHKLDAVRSLGMGAVVKIFLKMSKRLSDLPGVAPGLKACLDRARFVRTPGEPVPTWWITGEDDAPTMVGWIGGPAADRISGRGEDELVRTATDVLARALAIPRDNVAESVAAATAADWKQDPWARGAYSWIPAGALDAPRLLAEPLDDTLFFAGEATDTAGYRGTVHGALVTGMRAADEVLKSLR